MLADMLVKTSIILSALLILAAVYFREIILIKFYVISLALSIPLAIYLYKCKYRGN